MDEAVVCESWLAPLHRPDGTVVDATCLAGGGGRRRDRVTRVVSPRVGVQAAAARWLGISGNLRQSEQTVGARGRCPGPWERESEMDLHSPSSAGLPGVRTVILRRDVSRQRRRWTAS